MQGHDFTLTDTVYIPANTFDTKGASVTMSGLAVTDIEVYKNGSITQRASDNGYALLDTDGIDFDGLTGIHGISIDLSDNSDAGFYDNGNFYWVVISSVTIDGQTVSFVAATFSIGAVLRPTDAGNTLDVTNNGNAGIDWGNIENTTGVANLTGTRIFQVNDSVSQTGDNFARLGAPAGASVSADIAAVTGEAMPELAVGETPATPTLKQALMALYMALRDKTIVNKTVAELQIHNDAGTKIASKALTDDGNIYTEEKMV